MKLSLEVVTPGKTQGKVIPIQVSRFVIGRDPDCQLRPASPLISKRHCAVLVRDGKVFARDFDSTNGSFVNDRQFKGELELADGDTLKVGPLAFRLHIEGPATTPVDKPTPLPPTKTTTAVDDTDANAAALLLSMQDDAPPAGSPGVDSEGIPTGSTVMDIVNPPEGEGGEAGKAQGKKEEPVKKIGDTSAAAKSILDKYWRRPRF